MKSRRWLWAVLIAIIGLFALLYYVAIPALVQTWMTQLARENFVVGNEPYRGAGFCKTCHPQHYEQWRESLHSKSYTEVNFVHRAEELSWGMSIDKCFLCHSPLAKQGIAKEEGITCEVCHGPGMTRAVVRDVCVRCHLQPGAATTNPSALILSTPIEFEQSIAKRDGLNCANCHLPQKDEMSFHAFQGSRAAPEAYKGVIQVENIERRGSQIIVTVRNMVTGHWLPTGAETNVIFLNVHAYDAQGRQLSEGEYRFEKNPFFFRTMPMMVMSDTRLKDGERREIAFQLSESAARVSATISIKPTLWNGQVTRFVIDQKDFGLLSAR